MMWYSIPNLFPYFYMFIEEEGAEVPAEEVSEEVSEESKEECSDCDSSEEAAE